MQVVNFSIMLPDETHSATQVRVFGSGVRELTIEIPGQAFPEAANQPRAEPSENDRASAAAVRRAQDDYVLGGYAGI